LIERDVRPDPTLGEHLPALDAILEHGPLARRILARVGGGTDRDGLRAIYRELAGCLRDARLFL
jgi:carboxylate-amine ligase